MPTYDWIIHVQSNSSYKEATDHTITSQMNQAYVYLLMNNIKVNYAILTADLFSLPVKSDFEVLGQHVDVINPSLTRIDLYFISILNYEQLAEGAQYIKMIINNLIDFPDYLSYTTVDFSSYPEIPDDLVLDDLLHELDRLTNK